MFVTLVYVRVHPIQEFSCLNICSVACVHYILNKFSKKVLEYFVYILYKGNNASIFYAGGRERYVT
jgi:hypothetical protein